MNAARTTFYFLFGADGATDGDWGMYAYGSLSGERACKDGAAWRWRICTAWRALRERARGYRWYRPSQATA